MAIAKYTITCGGSFPSDRLACRPAATTASSMTSRRTDEARTPSETRSVHRLPAATPAFCVTGQDHPGQPPDRGNNTPRKQDQLTVSGIAPSPDDRFIRRSLRQWPGFRLLVEMRDLHT